jgi:hypothetical protein
MAFLPDGVPLPPWLVRHDPLAARFAFFLSHVSEDKPDVRVLKQEVEERLINFGCRLQQCYLDETDWSDCCPPAAQIQDAIFDSAHFVIWITPNLLKRSRRGWTWLEFAFAYQIERSRQALGEAFTPLIVPVFRKFSLKKLARTPLHDYLQRGLPNASKNVPIRDIAERLAKFFQEQDRARTA